MDPNTDPSSTPFCKSEANKGGVVQPVRCLTLTSTNPVNMNDPWLPNPNQMYGILWNSYIHTVTPETIPMLEHPPAKPVMDTSLNIQSSDILCQGMELSANFAC